MTVQTGMKVLDPEQARQLETQGYVVVDGVLDPERDLGPILAECDEVLDGIAQSLRAERAIGSTYEGLSFCERLIRICLESGRNFPQHFDISLPQSGVRHDTPIYVGSAAFRLLTNSRLLDLVEDVIGPEIYSNPVQHIRMKLPPRAVATREYSGLISKIPWHQDNGVILPEADASHVLTVWLPVTGATVQNGCLQVIPRTHGGGLVFHCPTGKGVAIPESLILRDQAVPIPMRPGSVLLMHQRTIHSSLDNMTENELRISCDLRYQPAGEPTGRPAFPGFIARSRRHPEAVLRDPAEWARLWYEARARLAEQEDPTYHRWRKDAAACA